MSDFEYKEEYAWLSNICLNVTDACNLACKYCFVEQNPHYMDLETAKSAVDFIVENAKKKEQKFKTEKKASLSFFGGEPTLLWDEIIVPITYYIKENNLPVDLGITTNGTLLNKERIQFLKENNIYPLLSIDGNKETQDFNRPCHNNENSSFDMISKNIPLLLEAFPNITFRSTIYAPTVDKTFENYLFAIEQGFNNIFMMPDGRHPWTQKQKDILCAEIDKIFMYNEICFINNIPIPNFSPIDKVQSRLIAFAFSLDKSPQLEISRNCERCGLGTGMGSIGYDGSIYGCQEQNSKEYKNIFYIGNINEGINIEKHSKLLKKYSKKGISKCANPSRCNICSLRKICQGFDCPSSSYDLYEDFLTDSEIHCLWEEKLTANAMTMCEKLWDNKNFKKYFERQVK